VPDQNGCDARTSDAFITGFLALFSGGAGVQPSCVRSMSAARFRSQMLLACGGGAMIFATQLAYGSRRCSYHALAISRLHKLMKLLQASAGVQYFCHGVNFAARAGQLGAKHCPRAEGCGESHESFKFAPTARRWQFVDEGAVDEMLPNPHLPRERRTSAKAIPVSTRRRGPHHLDRSMSS
jgi:hypothetical protein